jgi:hypothetical protein
MAGDGLKIEDKGGTLYLAGPLDEFADLTALLERPQPLKLNLRGVSRLNSIGIRHFLKFLSDWGARAITYEECPSEFVDQVNMVPSLLGARRQAVVGSLYAPYVCHHCDHEEEILCTNAEVQTVKAGGEPPARKCSDCGKETTLLSDTFFVFLTR